jgi:P-type Cu2+ transporter
MKNINKKTVIIAVSTLAVGLLLGWLLFSSSSQLLIRNRAAFENARKLTAIIFDKTVQSVSDKLSDNELLQIAASVENSSEHPIAGGIVRKAKTDGLEFDEPQNFQNITGKGIKATLNGQEIKIVSPGMLKEQGIESPSDFD